MGLFTDDEENEDQNRSDLPAAGDVDRRADSVAAAPVDDELFAAPTPDELGETSQTTSREGGDRGFENTKSRTPKASKIREGSTGPAADKADTVDIFAGKVGLNELQASMAFSLPEPDVAILENKLRAKLEDQVIATLQTLKQCARQFILIPRVSRFARDGVLYPCTLKNLAKIYIGSLRSGTWPSIEVARS